MKPSRMVSFSFLSLLSALCFSSPISLYADAPGLRAPGVSCQGREAWVRYPRLSGRRAYAFRVPCASPCIPARAVRVGGRVVFEQTGVASASSDARHTVAVVLHGSQIPSWSAFCAPPGFKANLSAKVAMVAHLLNAGMTVVSPQTAWGDRRQARGQRWSNQWRSARDGHQDLWTTPLQAPRSRCRVAGQSGTRCTDRVFFDVLFRHYGVQKPATKTVLIGFSSGGYMVSRLLHACSTQDEATRLHACPSHIQAAVINSAGDWRCPHNGLPSVLSGGGVQGCPKPGAYGVKAAPPMLFLWGARDHAVGGGHCCVDPRVTHRYYTAVKQAHPETTAFVEDAVGHQWLDAVASEAFVAWLLNPKGVFASS